MIKNDLANKIFGKLKVISFSHIGNHHKSYWNCECSCGVKKAIDRNSIVRGRTISCGCNKNQKTRERNYKHGKTGTKVYRIWKNMKVRCYSKNNHHYNNYGNRGIKICDKWRNSFPEFFKDMGEPPTKVHSIERIDNNGDYTPENCKWATPYEQSRNSRQNNCITFKGETLCLTDWAKKIKMNRATLLSRINRNKWPIERALTKSVNR